MLAFADLDLPFLPQASVMVLSWVSLDANLTREASAC